MNEQAGPLGAESTTKMTGVGKSEVDEDGQKNWESIISYHLPLTNRDGHRYSTNIGYCESSIIYVTTLGQNTLQY